MERNLETKDNAQSHTEDIAAGRRNFIKATGLAAMALGAGLGASASSALAATPPTKAPAKDFHDEIITIDGTSPLMGENHQEKFVDWYKQGRVTAFAPTMSEGPMSSVASLTDKLNTLDNLGFMLKLVHKRNDLIVVRTAADILKAKQEGKLGVMLNFQSPTAFEYNLDLVHMYKELGVGVVQLAYNVRNQFGNGILERGDSGLSHLGVALVKELNSARMIVDVAHTGVKTSFDAIETSSTPVIISHANSRNKFDSNRNVPDDLIKAIAQNGGFIGAVMYPAFVRKAPRPTLDDYIDHIKYLVDLVGPDHVAIGSDYFGGQWGVISDEEAQKLYERNIEVGAWDKATYPAPPWVYPKGIETPKTLYNLTAGLQRRGFAKDDIRKIWGESWLRVMKQVWGA
ncbi:dipeptidase [Petrachloros mirabilis]